MYGPPKEMLGGERFDDDAWVVQYVRNWLLKDSASFYYERIEFEQKHMSEMPIYIISVQIYKSQDHCMTLKRTRNISYL